MNILWIKGDRNAKTVYGMLKEAIAEAVELGYLPEWHPLAQKWLTDAKNLAELLNI